MKRVALEESLPVLTPDRPRGEDFLATIRKLAPDISVVVAYGHILEREVLDVPRLGSVNLHASLLPALRGAAPINWAIARGHQETGVTVMRMVEAMDAGPIIHQIAEPILPDTTATELMLRLSEIGAAALVEGLVLLGAGEVEEVEQDERAATYAPKIDRATARIDWTKSAEEVARHVRAMDAVPGAWTTLDGAAVKLFGPTPVPARTADSASAGAAEGGAADAPAPAAGRSSDSGPRGGRSAKNGGRPGEPARPGEVLEARPDEGVLVGAGSGAVLFREVQPSGSRRMSATDWINGRGISVGQQFE